MGIESPHSRPTFGLEELGLLDTHPSKSFDVIVDLCGQAVGVPIVAFIVFDDATASLVIRSAIRDSNIRTGPLKGQIADSVSALVREDQGLVSIDDLSARDDTKNAIERRVMGATGFIGAPVRGPADEIVGVLAAMSPTATSWTEKNWQLVRGYAYLMSEQVMLKAALQTVRLMASERQDQPPPTPYAN